MDTKYGELLKDVAHILEKSAHYLDHTIRVYDLCKKIGKNYPINERVLDPAALLHDVGRIKEDENITGTVCHAEESVKIAVPILIENNYSPKEISDISHCILTHRYRTRERPETIESKILFDCDKLDILGAIGIMRGTMWFGKHGGRLSLPEFSIEDYIKTNLDANSGRIKNKDIHSIFYEFETKTKYIPDSLFTEEARDIALARMEFMKNFIYELEREMKGII